MKKINDVSHVADVLQSELKRRFMKYTAPGVDGHLPAMLAATALDVRYRLLLISCTVGKCAEDAHETSKCWFCVQFFTCYKQSYIIMFTTGMIGTAKSL